MFDREIINDFKSALSPFLPLIIGMALLLGIGLSLLGFLAFSSKKTDAHQNVVAPSEDAEAAAVQPSTEPVQPVAPQDQPAVTSAPVQPKPKTTPAPKPSPAPTPAPATQPSPTFSVSFSGGGCLAVVKAQPGARVVIGAFNDNKGGESRFFMPASGTLIQGTSGIWGMTSFVQILAPDGSTAFYKTSTIAVEACPPAGVSEW